MKTYLDHKLMPNLRSFSFFFSSGLNQQKYKVLEMDENGTLYLYRSSLLCVNDIIKRLTEGTYKMAESSMLGRLRKTCNQSSGKNIKQTIKFFDLPLFHIPS